MFSASKLLTGAMRSSQRHHLRPKNSSNCKKCTELLGLLDKALDVSLATILFL
jgi:hypothetical protein